jgi:hypothetical protein
MNAAKIETNSLAHWDCDLPVNFNKEFGPKTPLVLLLSASAFEVIPIGQEVGMDVDASLSNGWSVLFHAIRQGSQPLVTALCKVTKAINWSCKVKWTPFHLAVQERNHAVCQILFKYGAHPHLFTGYRFCPFLLAKPLHPRDPTRETARVVRRILVQFFARLLMVECAKSLLQSERAEQEAADLEASEAEARFCEQPRFVVGEDFFPEVFEPFRPTAQNSFRTQVELERYMTRGFPVLRSQV